jgi:hypothetical protein
VELEGFLEWGAVPVHFEAFGEMGEGFCQCRGVLGVGETFDGVEGLEEGFAETGVGSEFGGPTRAELFVAERRVQQGEGVGGEPRFMVLEEPGEGGAGEEAEDVNLGEEIHVSNFLTMEWWSGGRRAQGAGSWVQGAAFRLCSLLLHSGENSENEIRIRRNQEQRA